MNRYTYVINNPLRLVDPTGMDPTDPPNDPPDYMPEFRPCTVGVEAGCTETETVIGAVTVTFTTTPTSIANDLTLIMATSVTERPLVSPNEPSAGQGFGWGFTGGGNLGAGIGLAGAGATGGGFLEHFFDENGVARAGVGLHGGAQAYIMAGPNAVTPRAILSAVPIDDDESASVIGRSAGAGGGVFFTNAARPEELRGPFHTTQVNTPVVSFQYDVSGPVWVVSITLGPDLGASYWSGKTSTITTPGLLFIPNRGV